MSSEDTQNLELQDIRSERPRSEEPSSVRTPALPKADSGSAAYLFLLGSFTIEMLLWGECFPFSFGILREYYINHEPFSSHSQGIAAVGTTCSGMMYLEASLVFALFRRWPRFCRQSAFYGLAIITIAIAASSFASSTWQLLLTQGILYAVGGGLLYYPIYIFIDEWFITRKGFAYGIMWAGTGCGGLVGPLLMNWGLSHYGAKTFLRGWAVAFFVLICPLLYYVRPRLPIPDNVRPLTRAQFALGFGFLKTRTFWALQLGNVVQGLGYFIPSLYLPSYATDLGFSSLTGSLMVAAINLASVPGVIFLSTLSDYTNVTNVIFISALGSALAVFLLWGFSTSLPVLVVFACLYGFFAGGFTSTYAGTVRELRVESPSADLGSIFGVLSVGRGLGNVICGPLSEMVLEEGGWRDRALLAYGSDYGPLIVFTGTTAAIALTPWVAKRLRII